MATRTATDTTTFAFADIREVWRQVGQEISAICRAAGAVASDFDSEKAIVDCNMLAMNNIIVALALQFYVGSEIIREYRYQVITGPFGDRKSGGDPPLGAIPTEARVRLVVTPNTAVPEDQRRRWLDRLGWRTARTLTAPAGAKHQVYGHFTSGGYGLERSVLVHPAYDRPVDRSAGALFTNREEE